MAVTQAQQTVQRSEFYQVVGSLSGLVGLLATATVFEHFEQSDSFFATLIMIMKFCVLLASSVMSICFAIVAILAMLKKPLQSDDATHIG